MVHTFEMGVGTKLALVMFVALAVSGCATTSGTTMVDNRPGSSGGKYVDSEAQSNLKTVGIESSDLKGACAKMVGEMLANPLLTRSDRPPHVIVDAAYFSIQTATRINKNIFVDQLRSTLVNAANGRMIFVAREASGMVMEERELEEDGITGQGTTPGSARVLGADYRMQGRITDHTEYGGGTTERYTVILVEMIDLKTSQLVFSGTYDFKKRQQAGKAYR